MNDDLCYFVVFSGKTAQTMNFHGMNRFGSLDEANTFIDSLLENYEWNLLIGDEIDFSERYD